MLCFLCSTFASAKNYASTAVNAVNTYREIYRLINESLVAANTANQTASQITQLVSRLCKFFSNMLGSVNMVMKIVILIFARTQV